MKKILLMTTLTFFSLSSWSQENGITLSGGYSFAKVSDTEINATGWRINGAYEFQPLGGNFAHGLSVGYVKISGEKTDAAFTTNYDIGAWPIYYAPKLLFGNETVKGFVKGAIGWQFSHLERAGTIATIEDNDAGFSGGVGAGASYSFNDKLFLVAEYELLWMSNSFYNDGWLNTTSLGLGFKF